MNEFLSVFVTEFLKVAAPILASLLAAWLVTLIRSEWASLKLKFPKEVEVAQDVFRIAVHAAEQAGAVGLVESKKDYAVSVAQTWLKQRGFNIDLFVIEAGIEAAVLNEFNSSNLGGMIAVRDYESEGGE